MVAREGKNVGNMTVLVDVIRRFISGLIRAIARPLNRLTGGKLHPDAITIIGLLAHIPIALLIATAHPLKAAALLVVFGLFDKLDGELARLQGRSSVRGMLLDASTDRLKEVMIYAGIAYYFENGRYVDGLAFWAVLALGASLAVSYVKAKGEAAIASSGRQFSHAELNKLFADGLMLFEVRMTLLLIGLLSGQLVFVVMGIAVLAGLTAISRLIRISRKL